MSNIYCNLQPLVILLSRWNYMISTLCISSVTGCSPLVYGKCYPPCWLSRWCLADFTHQLIRHHTYIKAGHQAAGMRWKEQTRSCDSSRGPRNICVWVLGAGVWFWFLKFVYRTFISSAGFLFSPEHFLPLLCSWQASIPLSSPSCPTAVWFTPLSVPQCFLWCCISSPAICYLSDYLFSHLPPLFSLIVPDLVAIVSSIAIFTNVFFSSCVCVPSLYLVLFHWCLLAC